MSATFGSLSVVPWILFAQMSWGMDAVPVITAAQPSFEEGAEVLDGGEVFSDGAERRAREALGRIHRQHRAPIRIETVKSLNGAWVADAAGRRARATGAQRLYILIAGSERDVGVIAARRGPAIRLTDQHRETIRRAFLAPLREGAGDEALDQGIRAIGVVFDDAANDRGPGAREAWAAAAIILPVLAILLAPWVWVRVEDWRRRRRTAVAGAARPGQEDDSSSPGRAAPGTSQVASARAYSIPSRVE